MRLRQVERKSEPASQIGMILVLFVLLRLSILFFFVPQGLNFAQSDFAFYYNTFRLSERGNYPFINMWYEYPPLLAYLPWPAYQAARLLSPLVGDAPEQVFGRLLSLELLLMDAGTLLLLHRIGRRLWNLERANWLGWVYSALPMPLMMLTFSNQAAAVFILLLAVALFVEGRTRLAALALGLAVATKLLPIFLLAPMLRFLWPSRRRIVETIALAVLSAAFAYLPFLLLGGGPWIAASFRALLHGRSYATVWSMLDGNWGAGYYGPLETRLSLAASAAQYGNPPVVPALVVLLAFGALYAPLFFRRLPSYDVRQSRGVQAWGFVVFSILTAALFFLCLKGWSPQYALWIIPLALLAWPGWRGLALALLLSAVSTTHWTGSPTAMSILILARAAVLVGIAVLAAHQLWPARLAQPAGLPVPVTGRAPVVDPDPTNNHEET